MAAAPRILITRSAHQTSTLAQALARLGADPILIPTISLAPPTSFCPLDASLAQLPSFRWLLFTSTNAVHAFAGRARRVAPHLLPSTAQITQNTVSHGLSTLFDGAHSTQKIAAIGPATAAALHQLGLTPALIPPIAVAESLAEALRPYALEPDGTPTRMLLLRAEQAPDILPEALRAAGADLTVVPVYQNLIPTDSIPLLQALFRSPATWPDAITFTSSSTASNLLTLLEAARLTLPPDPPITPSAAHPISHKTILRASIGPITSTTLRNLGYPPHLESPESTIPSLVQTLATALHL